MMNTDSIAEALFSSTLQPSENPTVEQTLAAVDDSLHRHGGTRGCAAACAAEYGDHPEIAPARMRWAVSLARSVGPRVGLAA